MFSSYFVFCFIVSLASWIPASGFVCIIITMSSYAWLYPFFFLNTAALEIITQYVNSVVLHDFFRLLIVEYLIFIIFCRFCIILWELNRSPPLQSNCKVENLTMQIECFLIFLLLGMEFLRTWVMWRNWYMFTNLWQSDWFPLMLLIKILCTCISNTSSCSWKTSMFLALIFLNVYHGFLQTYISFFFPILIST